MSDDSLQRVMAFNRELTALLGTGLPLDLGFSGPIGSIERELQKANTILAERVGGGQTVEQAISRDTELPIEYRAAILAWLRCDDPTVALDGIAQRANARRQFGRNLGRTLFYPLIVLTLAYLGFIYLCNVTVPKIESIYGQLGESPSDSLSILIAARNLMPIWGPLVPVLIVVAVVWWRSRLPNASWTWVPGSSRYLSAMRNASLARQLAMLLESGYSLDDSLELVGPLSVADGIAAPATGDPATGDPATGDPATGAQAQTGPDGGDLKARLPSLLHWAVSSDLGGEPLPRVLQFVAKTYRQTAERQQKTWQVVMPTICGVLLAGVLVFGFGLSLFWPLVQLLKDISIPGGA